MGYGPGSFQMVYGKAQAAYFAAGNGTMEEKEWQDMLNMHLMNICNFVWKVGSFYCY